MFARRITILVGHFGSGKTEIAINGVLAMAGRGERVTLHVHVPKGKFIRFDPRFHELRPYLYYMMNSPGDSLFRMTDSGIEAWTPGQK